MIDIDLESRHDAFLPDRPRKKAPNPTKRQSIRIFFFGGIDNELSYITERVLLPEIEQCIQNSFQLFFHAHSSTCALCERVLRFILNLIILP